MSCIEPHKLKHPMFRLDQSNDYAWPVKVQALHQDGTSSEQTFTARFLRLSQPELEQLLADINDGQIDDPALFKRVLVGWKDVVAEGKPVEFTEDSRGRLEAVLGVRAAVINAFFDSVREAQKKI